MEFDEKDMMIDILVNGLDVKYFEFEDLNAVGKDLIKFFVYEEDDFFCWLEGPNLLFSVGNYTGEIYLEMFHDIFLFKVVGDEEPFNMSMCGRFVSIVLKYLESLYDERSDIQEQEIAPQQEMNELSSFDIKSKNSFKNFSVKDAMKKIEKINRTYYK